MKEEKIKVLALLPMELPKEIELDNTLEAMQKFVGGLIECITLSDTGSAVTLVCNDEGKLLGLPLNRPLWDVADVLAGRDFWPDAITRVSSIRVFERFQSQNVRREKFILYYERPNNDMSGGLYYEIDERRPTETVGAKRRGSANDLL